MPFSYLLAGGLSLRSFAPGSGFSLIRHAENLLDPWIDKLAMFAHIVLELVEPLPGCKYPVDPDRFG